MTDHTFEYNPVPSSKPMMNRNNLKSNGNKNEDEKNDNKLNRTNKYWFKKYVKKKLSFK